MAIDMKEPAVKAPWPPKEENEGRAKGESFFTIARKHKIGAGDLVNYNFQTKNSGEINWYLANYIGCPAPKHGQRYFEFAGAPYDPVKIQQHDEQGAGWAVLRDLLQPGQARRQSRRRHHPGLE